MNKDKNTTIDILIEAHIPEIERAVLTRQDLNYIKALTKMYTPAYTTAHKYFYELANITIDMYNKASKILPERKARYESLLLITTHAIKTKHLNSSNAENNNIDESDVYIV